MPDSRAIGFDNERYVLAQTQALLDRVSRFGNKLYMEFGGKLLFDYHAARVFPGFDPNVKVKSLVQIRDRIELLFCVNAKDVQGGRVRGDFGMTYDMATLRTLDDLKDWGLPVTAVVITRYRGQPAADRLQRRLERRGVRVYLHSDVAGYPDDVARVTSEEGFGRNAFIETTRPIVVVTGAGPGSGKIETALQQIWHEKKRGTLAGFAKWETFPVWDLPLDHPVNVAYEAATADIQDRNMIDPFHLEAYGREVVNYNRDVEHFPILRKLMEALVGLGDDVPRYRSPTDMCVNCASHGIVDQAVVREAASQEIIRRFLRYQWEYKIGVERKETLDIAQRLMEQVGARLEDRPTLLPARLAAAEARRKGQATDGAFSGAAIELPSGEVVTGKSSDLLYATSSAVINAVKRLAGIPDRIHLLSPLVIHNLVSLKRDVLGSGARSLDIAETLAALSVSAAHNPAAQECFEKLGVLKRCEMHMTHAPSQSDQETLRKLGIMFTTDAEFAPGGFFLR